MAEEAFCLKSAPVDIPGFVNPGSYVPGFVVPGVDMEPEHLLCTGTVQQLNILIFSTLLNCFHVHCITKCITDVNMADVVDTVSFSDCQKFFLHVSRMQLSGMIKSGCRS